MEIETIVTATTTCCDRMLLPEWREGAVQFGKELNWVLMKGWNEDSFSEIIPICTVSSLHSTVGIFEWLLVAFSEIPVEKLDMKLLEAVLEKLGFQLDSFMEWISQVGYSKLIITKLPFTIREVPTVKVLLGLLDIQVPLISLMRAYTAFIGNENMEAAFALAEITKVLPFMDELKPFLELVGPERANLLMTSGKYHFPVFGAKEPSVHDERAARRIAEGLLDIARTVFKSATPYTFARRFLAASNPDPQAQHYYNGIMFTFEGLAELESHFLVDAAGWSFTLPFMQQALQKVISFETQRRWFRIRLAIRLNHPWYLDQLEEFYQPGGRGPEWPFELSNLEAFGRMPPHEFTCDEEAVRPTKRSRTCK
jgi:hypothetical protein